MRSLRFFFHFNKPMTQRNGEVIWSVHHANKCYFVNDIHCLVPTETKKNKRQPKAVMQGFCKDIVVKNGVATIC